MGAVSNRMRCIQRKHSKCTSIALDMYSEHGDFASLNADLRFLATSAKMFLCNNKRIKTTRR